MRMRLSVILGKIPIPSPAMVVALLALFIAASGTAVAAISYTASDGTITACRDNRTGSLRVINVQGGQACSAKETTITWKDGITGKVTDSDKLDGKDSSDFATQTALNDEAQARAGADAALRADLTGGNGGSSNAAQVLTSQPGPLPVQGTYTSQGGTLVILANGSMNPHYYGRDHDQLSPYGAEVYVDGVPEAVVRTSLEGTYDFDSYIVVKGLAAGEHTIRLEAKGPATLTPETGWQCPAGDTSYCTITTDQNFYNVTVLELPANTS